MIHQYINNGFYIVLDVNSGSVHVTDRLMYEAIGLAESLVGELPAPEKFPPAHRETLRQALLKRGFPLPEVLEALSDMEELIDRGELFTKDTYENYMQDFKARKTVVKAFAFTSPMTAIWPANTALPRKGSITAVGL